MANRSGRTQPEGLLDLPNGQRKLTCKKKAVHEQDASPNKSQYEICPTCKGSGKGNLWVGMYNDGSCLRCKGTGQTSSVR